MQYTKTYLVLLVFAICYLFGQRASAQTQISNSVLGNGGAVLTGISHRLIGTVGQPAIGVASNSANIHQAGFWYPVGALVTSVEQIPLGNHPKRIQAGAELSQSV